MKVALITPWDNAWIPYFKDAIEKRGHVFVHAKNWLEMKGCEVVIHGWCDGSVAPYPSARNIVFLRRYELFSGGLSRVDWPKVDALIVVNSWIKEVVERIFKQKNIDVPVHLIYNGTDVSRWTYKDRKPGKRIGMACHVHPKKNLPLAMQILASLPDDYELHIAGEIQDPCTAEYLNHMGKVMRRRVYLYGHIPREQLDIWWEQMNYCLSTSISEGNPNNVIEAMAKGIKPIVHNWPGADSQFREYMRFSTSEDAANNIQFGEYLSADYRNHIESYFSLANYDRVLEIALEQECALA